MKSVLACVLLGLGSVSSLQSWDQEFTTADRRQLNFVGLFEGWQAAFGKHYANLGEKSHRFEVWLANLEMIMDHNSAGRSWSMKLNQFGDLTQDEFEAKMLGFKDSRPKHVRSIKELSKGSLLGADGSDIRDVPDSIDWTDINGTSYVTPVKNQGDCGSCWAFSTTGSMECRHAISTGTLTSLSEQQLVDCSDSEGNEGCDGGLMDNAFEYIEKEGGLCSEDEYPYKGRDGVCKADECGTIYSPISSYNDVTSDDATALQDGAATGCVSVAVDATTWQFYSKGVYSDTCGDVLDHGVLVVGYGKEDTDEYWKVKNSWGRTWGMDGYILLCRDCGGVMGECGILRQPSYPDPQT